MPRRKVQEGSYKEYVHGYMPETVTYRYITVLGRKIILNRDVPTQKDEKGNFFVVIWGIKYYLD